MDKDFLSGFVSIIGRPNVGKSTLINALVGEKVAITSSKPQTTRNKIRAVLNGGGFQAVFVDTPGIHGAKHKLDNYMQKSVDTVLKEIDAVMYLIEPSVKLFDKDEGVIQKIKNIDTPVFLVINKIDKIERTELFGIIEKYKSLYDFAEILPVSALAGENLDALIKAVKKYLPKGPKYFPDDYITDQPERQIAGEFIREKALRFLNEEIPHGIAVEISVMKERAGRDRLVDIEAVIYCEKSSHKGILIGKNGVMLKKIGSAARSDIENLLGVKVNLKTWVKVKDNWRDNDFLLRNFGYNSKNL